MISLRELWNFVSCKEWCLQKRHQVLIVDDNDFVVDYLIRMMRDLNADFQVASGEGAVEIVQKQMSNGFLFDMIVMDLFMP